MKEFKTAMRTATNMSQFSQLCKDAYSEMNVEKRGRISTMEVFNNYYNLNFSLLQLARMGKYIESGKYKETLKNYRSKGEVV